MTFLDELRVIAPPPDEPVELPTGGLVVPADYIALATAYGQGEFCDLIHLETPDDEILDYDREAKEDDPEYYPYPLHPEPGGLLPWGATSNGDLLCWLTEGQVDTWRTVVWDQRSAEYEEHPLGATAFLAGWLSGRVVSELLPQAFREHSQWFDPPRPMSFITVRLSPHRQDLDVLRATLGDTVLRRSVSGQHIVAAGDWRVTYNPDGLDIACPPEQRKQAREAITRITAALGCTLL